MAHIHGVWGHYVRPGYDRVNNGSRGPYIKTSGGSKTNARNLRAPSQKIQLTISDTTGKVLFQCNGRKEAGRVMACLESELPSGSYSTRFDGIHLLQSLDELGFSSPEEFFHFCAAAISFTRSGMPARSSRKHEAAGMHNSDPARAFKSHPTSEPKLTDSEIAKLDRYTRMYRIDHGWEGWDTIIKGRSRSFLQREAKRLGFDKPDDSCWTKDEEAILYRNCTKIWSNSSTWRSLLPRKSESAITKKYAELRQRAQQLRERDTNAAALQEAKRKEWETEIVSRWYDLYGWKWEQWDRLIPWRTANDVRALANELGFEEPWNDDEKCEFLALEYPDWSLEELNCLIDCCPVLDADSEAWQFILPGKDATVRNELSELLDVPCGGELRDLVAKAALLA